MPAHSAALSVRVYHVAALNILLAAFVQIRGAYGVGDHPPATVVQSVSTHKHMFMNVSAYFNILKHLKIASALPKQHKLSVHCLTAFTLTCRLVRCALSAYFHTPYNQISRAMAAGEWADSRRCSHLCGVP